jgi:hypothetical protein
MFQTIFNTSEKERELYEKQIWELSEEVKFLKEEIQFLRGIISDKK